MPAPLLHFVPSGSTINGLEVYRTTVIPPAASNAQNWTVNAGEWLTPYHQSLPYAFCIADNCSAGAGAKKHAYLTDPVRLSTTNGGIPVLSVHQISNTTWVSTLSTMNANGVTDPANTRSITVNKENVDPNQPIEFFITTGNWGHDPGTKVVLTAQANLTPNGSALDYNITATASQAIAMVIPFNIWLKDETAGDRSVFSDSIICASGTTCIASGQVPYNKLARQEFTPPNGATYFTNATITYLVPMTLANGTTVPKPFDIAPQSAKVASSTSYVAFAEGCDCVAGQPYCDCRDPSSEGINNLGSNPEGCAREFVDQMNEKGNKNGVYIDGWSTILHQNGNARETHWNSKKKDYLEKGDFGFYAGHGNEGRFTFCHKDAVLHKSVLNPSVWKSGRINS